MVQVQPRTTLVFCIVKEQQRPAQRQNIGKAFSYFTFAAEGGNKEAAKLIEAADARFT